MEAIYPIVVDDNCSILDFLLGLSIVAMELKSQLPSSKGAIQSTEARDNCRSDTANSPPREDHLLQLVMMTLSSSPLRFSG
jgi:hypothetical protein